MRISYFSIIIMSVFIISLASTTGTFAQNSNTVTTCYAGNLCSTHVANNTDIVNIVDIHTQPSSIKVGDMFKITATLVNNSPDPIFVVIDDCEGPFAVTFDNHVVIQNNNSACAYSLFHQTLNSNEMTSKTSPGTTLVYKAVSAGTTNATITFSYFTKNQTDHTQPEIKKTISKSFQFDVQDNKTNAIPPEGKPPEKLAIVKGLNSDELGRSPLKQFKSGIAAKDVQCPENLLLVFKAKDDSPACVKINTVFRLSALGWGYPPSPFITKTDLLNSKISGGAIKEFQYDIQSRSIIIKIQTTSDGSLMITIPKIITDLKQSGNPFKDFTILDDGMQESVALVPTTNGSSFTIPFANGTQEIEIIENQVGQQN